MWQNILYISYSEQLIIYKNCLFGSFNEKMSIQKDFFEKIQNNCK